MKPKEYEEYVASIFQNKGYSTEVTPLSGDWGIDVIAIKDSEKIAIQAKMYSDSSRKVNRAAIMQLYGAMAYQDCTKAVLATDGDLLDDAILVANKLGIEILKTNPCDISDKGSCIGIKTEKSLPVEINGYPAFDEVWEKYIIPLKGTTLCNSRGENKIIDVNWSGVKRKTSKGKEGKVNIEGFRYSYNELLRKKKVTRDEISQQIAERCSSFIVLILKQIPFIELVENPISLKLK